MLDIDREELLHRASLVGTDAKNPEEKLLAFVEAWGRKQVADSESKHIEIYRWLLGYTNFPSCPNGKKYCWRTALREKLPKHILTKLQGGKK